VGGGAQMSAGGRRALVLAHRGSHARQRENTVPAFLEAAALGADGVELDVRRTADGLLVVHHDAEIAGVGVVEELPASALPSHVPALEEALEAVAGMLVNIEVKRAGEELAGGDRTAALLVEALAGRDDRVVVSSFSADAVDVVAAAGSIETALLVAGVPEGLDLPALAAGRGYRGVHPPDGGTTRELVERCQGLGLSVRVWTVNDPARGEELARFGVDAVITDDAPAVLAALGRTPPAQLEAVEWEPGWSRARPS
jgi:glycerophosphoryl diester phosphodiesterase